MDRICPVGQLGGREVSRKLLHIILTRLCCPDTPSTPAISRLSTVLVHLGGGVFLLLVLLIKSKTAANSLWSFSECLSFMCKTET